MVTSPDAPEIHTYIEISLEHLIFQAVLHRSWSRRHYNCVGNKFLKKLYQQDSYKFLISTHNLGFRILGFYHRDQWRGAGSLPAKNAGVLAMDWLPVCGALRRIIACRLNFEIRIGAAHSIHEFDSDKVMEPCISKVEKAKHAEFNVPTCGKMAFWLLCKETQPLWNSHDSWWPELNMFGSMPWCSFPCHKLLPKLAQKTCCRV